MALPYAVPLEHNYSDRCSKRKNPFFCPSPPLQIQCQQHKLFVYAVNFVLWYLVSFHTGLARLLKPGNEIVVPMDITVTLTSMSDTPSFHICNVHVLILPLSATEEELPVALLWLSS